MIPFHPLADIFPLIEGPDFDALVSDIRDNGLREPIVLLEGTILDGRNRYRACVAAGLIPEELAGPSAGCLKYFHSFVPAGFPTPPQEGLLAYVISKNLRRRHLNESQRGMVAANLVTMKQGTRTDVRPSANLQKVAQDQAANSLNVSTRTVADSVKVKREGTAELRAAVEQGHIAVSLAAKAVDMPEDRQRAIVERARSGDPSGAKGEIKKAARETRERELGARQQALPDKKYGVILADPEWEHVAWSDAGLAKAAANHYPISSIETIKARPVASIAAADCVLFMWTTVPHLAQAFDVIVTWGFEYKTCAIWNKTYPGAQQGMGYWFRINHEILLVATRGNVPAPAPGTQFGSVFSSTPGDHSVKPDWQYELIESYFPTLPKIELNARRAREGWQSWGLEAPAEDAA
jgi:N6-adenosine-specific RNA methylase IME4